VSGAARRDRSVAKPVVVARIADSASCLPDGKLGHKDDPRSASSCGTNEAMPAGKPQIFGKTSAEL